MISTLKAAALALCLGATSGALADDAPHIFKDLSEADIHTGTSQYLVFLKDKPTGNIHGISLWERTTNIIEEDDKKLVEVKQTWSSDDPRFKRELYSLVHLKDFTPIMHRTVIGEEKTVRAFKYTDGKILGDPDVAGNAVAGFTMPDEATSYNWELDMETLALLPLGEGKEFAVPFYHPGSKTPPKAYTYKVVGSDTLTTQEGNPIEAWMLRIDHDGKGQSTFWMDKRTGALLKLEEAWGDIVRYKVRLDIPVGTVH